MAQDAGHKTINNRLARHFWPTKQNSKNSSKLFLQNGFFPEPCVLLKESKLCYCSKFTPRASVPKLMVTINLPFLGKKIHLFLFTNHIWSPVSDMFCQHFRGNIARKVTCVILVVYLKIVSGVVSVSGKLRVCRVKLVLANARVTFLVVPCSACGLKWKVYFLFNPLLLQECKSYAPN